jgi:CRP-like cAMP-binding protein
MNICIGGWDFCTGGWILNGARISPDTVLDKLSRLKGLSWLSAPELKLVAGTLRAANFNRHQVILPEAAFASEVHILLTGIACITSQKGRNERVTVALLAPGPIPEFPSPRLSRFDFRCEAYSDCKLGSLSWNDFNRITEHSSESAVKKFHENDLQQWYRLLLRNSGFLNLDLHERVAITLLELASDFGIAAARGKLLRAFFSHQVIADLVGASRPRVTEHLEQLEREHLLVRQGRQLIVDVDKIGHSQN